MNRVLFAERFTVLPAPITQERAEGVYDDARGYTMTPLGVPLVELAPADDTTTMTFVETEKPDTDRDWEPAVASVDTFTKARADREHWGGWVRRTLFADRFTSVPEAEPVSPSFYDERRGYTVTADGRPFVETQPAASTNTMTRVQAEQSDSDRAWDAVLGVGTRTQAREDRDHW